MNNPMTPTPEPITSDGTASSSGIAFEDSKDKQLVFRERDFKEAGDRKETPAVRAAKAVDIGRLAGELGVSAASLRRMNVSICKEGWLFPMLDKEGEVTGYRLRGFNGGKWMRRGGHSGLFIPNGVDSATNVTEGESDLAAALDLNLTAIGRPGATACVDETVDYFASERVRAITIIGDNDPAGKQGAEKLAAALLNAGHLVRIVYPPAPYKDLREWYIRERLTPAQFHKHADMFEWQVPPGIPPGFVQIGNWQLRGGLIRELGISFDVLLVIQSFRGRDGLCVVTRHKIAWLIGKSVATVDRSLGVLKKKGLLEVVDRGYEGRASRYRVHLGPVDGKKGQKRQ